MTASAEQLHTISNHKELVPLEHYLEEYAKADPEEISRRTGFVFHPASGNNESVCLSGYFSIRYLHRSYEVSWPTYEIRCIDASNMYAPLQESNPSKILVLRYLLEGTQVDGTGNYLTYRDVPWGEVYYRQFSGRCLSRLAFSYGNRLEDYRRRMERIGAAAIKESDAGYEYEIFPGFKVRFLIWAGDEEFPPSAQILFSDNFVAAFHPEDLVVVSEVMIGALKQV